MSGYERTGWRDQKISQRHRVWGFNCPAVDLDFLVAEYHLGKPVALIEYKDHHAQPPVILHPTYRALTDLADNYNPNPLPFLIVFYWPDIWAFRVMPINACASAHFQENEVLSELDFVRRLYRMRSLVLTGSLIKVLHTELPPKSHATEPGKVSI